MTKSKLNLKAPAGCSIFILVLWAYTIIAWGVNLVKLLKCDFEAPYKDEIIHAIGLIPGASMITCWF